MESSLPAVGSMSAMTMLSSSTTTTTLSRLRRGLMPTFVPTALVFPDTVDLWMRNFARSGSPSFLSARLVGTMVPFLWFAPGRGTELPEQSKPRLPVSGNLLEFNRQQREPPLQCLLHQERVLQKYSGNGCW